MEVFTRTNANARCDLEVVPATEPEQIIPPNIHLEDKNYDSSGSMQNGKTIPSVQFSPMGQLSQSSTAFRTLAIVAIICLAAALGAGLGGGLAARQKHYSVT